MKRFIPTFSVHWTREGQPPPPVFRAQCRGGVAEALLWFHLERQLRDGLTPAEYSVQEVTTDHESPQRWHGHELPKVASINKAVITRVMAKEYAPEIEAYRQRGGFLYEG